MTLPKLRLFLTFYLPVTVTALHAQYVVTFQGPLSSDPTVAVFESSTFAPVATLSVPGAFQFLSLADGSKHYLISNVAGPAITVIDQTFSNPVQAGNFLNPVNSAAISPDGTRLVAGENSVHVFDTSSDTDLTPDGIAVGGGAKIIDVVISYDSQTAYALGVLNGQSFLAAINLAQDAVNQTLNISGTATALALGPNGLLYVSSANQILEINPLPMAATTGGVITVDAQPGRLVFTPDGHYGLTANQTPDTGSAVLLLDLTTHIIAGTVSNAGLTAPFDTLLVASSSLVYAFSSALQSLYALQIGSNGGIILNVPNVPGVAFSAVSAAGLSTDLGVPGRNAPQYLFVVSSGVLYRIDPVSNMLTQQTALTSAPGEVAYFAPTATNNTPFTALVYGNNQTVLPGVTALPLVVRVLDGNGLPISGAQISFAAISGAGTPSGTTNPATAVTGADGYAEAIFTAGTTPNDLGAIAVTATIGPLSAAFTVNVATAAPTPEALSIVSGQGQVILADFIIGTPLTVAPFIVLATDANGAPVPNALVTFTLASGTGALTPVSGGLGQNAVVAATDATGQASATFVPPVVFWYQGVSGIFVGSTVTATTGPATVNFNINTVPVNTQACGTPPCPATSYPLVAQIVKPLQGTTVSGVANSTLPGAVQVSVTLAGGLPVPNVGLQVNTGTDLTVPNAHCADPTGAGTVLTDATGVATCDLVLNGVPGTLPLTAQIPVGGNSIPSLGFPDWNLTITAGAAAAVNIISGNNQSANPGATLPLPFVAQVTDSNNLPIQTAVSWAVTSGSMSLSGATTATDATGQASATGVAGNTPGPVIVTVTAGSASVSFNAVVSVAAASITVVSGDGQNALTGSPFGAPLVVQLTDANGLPAAFGTVTFAVTSGDASVDTPMTTADVTGLASTTVSAGATAGPVTVNATSGGMTATFSLTVAAPGPAGVTIVNSASFTASIAPGGLISVFGTSLTDSITGTVTDPSQFGGYSLSFGAITAPILALINPGGMEQINAQVPFEVPPGPASVTIQTPQGPITINNVVVSPLAPAIFTNGTLSANGQTYPLALALRSDGSYVGDSNPVQAGETITFFATGLGQTDPAAATNVPGVPGQVVTGALYAGVNHQGDALVSAVYQPGLVGVYAVSIQIPASATAGPAQALSLQMADAAGVAYSAPDTFIPIQ